MKAYQVTEFGKPLECREVEIPKISDHEVLAKTLVTGFCHTDVHVVDGDLGEVPLPLTPGHEGVGVVVSVGARVTKFKVGDRVGVPWLGESCMKCDLCNSKRQNLCVTQRQTGFLRHGSFAEYFAADERFAAKIPENLSSPHAAPILCAGLTAYKALLNAHAPKGSRIVISGAAGGLGHLAIQYAKIMGYEVVALDIMDSEKASLMKKLGADYVVDLHDKSMALKDRLRKLDEKASPITAVIVFAPVSSAVYDASLYVSPGGTIVCVGLPKGSLNVQAIDFVLKELRLQGSIVGTPEDLEEALKIAADNGIFPHVEIRHVSKVNEVLSEIRAGKVTGRIVLEVSSNQ